jgi:hypothetical protein
VVKGGCNRAFDQKCWIFDGEEQTSNVHLVLLNINEVAYLCRPTLFFDCRESTLKQKDEKTVLNFLALFQTLKLQLCR